MRRVTVVGGGLAGLVAAITCAEAGVQVRLLEAHTSLGGRARATAPPYVAHQGPHVLYSDGPWWRWLAERDLIGPYSAVPLGALAGFRFRCGGRLRRTPPAALLRVLARRGQRAPVDVDFHTWLRGQHSDVAAEMAANLMGVATFDAQPGRLSAAFIWQRLLRVFAPNPPARYVTGGWNGLIDRLARYAQARGVAVETGARVTYLPEPPVIVATSLDAAGRLLHTAFPTVQSGRTVLLDVAVRARRGDAFVVSDLDEAGWLERYTLPDPTLAPPGESLIQAQLPLRPGERKADGLARLEAMVDQALPDWRARVTWRRDGIANRRTGALDPPGQTWRDRPAVQHDDGVFLAGDMVGAPGLLSEVSFHSATAAARGTLTRPRTGASKSDIGRSVDRSQTTSRSGPPCHQPNHESIRGAGMSNAVIEVGREAQAHLSPALLPTAAASARESKDCSGSSAPAPSRTPYSEPSLNAPPIDVEGEGLLPSS